MAGVEQVVLIASNLPVSSVDAALLASSSAELRDARPHPTAARLWVLLHEQKVSTHTETERTDDDKVAKTTKEDEK